MVKKKQSFVEKILARLAEKEYRPLRSKELAEALDVSRNNYRSFRDTLRLLQKDEKVARQDGGRWALPGAAEAGGDILDGVLHLARDGYGFLVPDDASRDDVFIPEECLCAALDGDRVRVAAEKGRGRDYRHYGRVLEVLERASPRIVALLVEGDLARPENPKNPYDFAVKKRSAPCRLHDKVLLEITCWPGEGPEPAGDVIEVLGQAGEPGTETRAILASYDAPGPFPEEVKDEVRNLSRPRDGAEYPDRLDLRQAITYTIDPEDARDYDDALSYEEREDGTIVAGVHIADVSAFVKPGSRLDVEARERSTSIYLPGRVIPMLPEELSGDICSLRAGEDRLAKTVLLHYDRDGNRLGFHIHRSVIRSRKRFTYREARGVLEDEALAAAFPDREVLASLRGVRDLAAKLRARRLEKGCIELNIPEFRVILDENGEAADIVQVENDFSHQLVEDLMLAANVAVAEWAAENALPVLHRIHESPAEEDVEDLALFLTASGYPFKPPFDRRRLNAVIAKVRGKPEEHALNLAILKSFRQAVYGPAPDVGHFALNFPRYLHFTSPIRRYPDLHLHQALERCFADGADKLPRRLHAKPAGSGAKALESLGTHTSQRERRAMKIENDVKDFRRLELLSRRDQRDFTAVVTGIKKFGVFVEIEDYYVEGLLPRWMLEKKGFSTREEQPGAAARAGKDGRCAPGFHLGQEVTVRITGIDLAARVCEMEFLGLPERD